MPVRIFACSKHMEYLMILMCCIVVHTLILAVLVFLLKKISLSLSFSLFLSLLSFSLSLFLSLSLLSTSRLRISSCGRPTRLSAAGSCSLEFCARQTHRSVWNQSITAIDLDLILHMSCYRSHSSIAGTNAVQQWRPLYVDLLVQFLKIYVWASEVIFCWCSSHNAFRTTFENCTVVTWMSFEQRCHISQPIGI